MPFHSPVSGGGKVVDVKVATGLEASTTEVIPGDNTIPQQSEGTEYLTLAITPKKTTNRLFVEFNCLMSGNNNNVVPIIMLFRDSGEDALQVRYDRVNGSSFSINMHMVADVAAASVSETIFKIRFGKIDSGGATTYMMQNGNGALFGASDHAVFRITEYEP